MARVVYLHVGAPKTGTTYLQDRLYLNRVSLESHGVSYPVGLRADMFGPALDLLDRPWGGQREGVRGEWDALVGRVRRASRKVVLSHEILAGARPERVRKAMAELGAAGEVHLVYSARDLARQIPAEWQENVKHQRARSFKGFVRELQDSPRRRSSLWFWRVQGLPDVLERWSRGLPPERVHLVTVPPPGAPREELWLRYCRAFGIDPSWSPEESERENVSIGAAEAALVRRLNRRLRRVGFEAEDYRRLVRELVVHQTLARRDGMSRVTLPPEEYPWAAEIAEEWVEWAVGAGIDVVGDLDDLRPVPPLADEEWRDPDRPRQARVVDAALDALVALLQEAAARPDPDAQISARVARAARRLRGQ